MAIFMLSVYKKFMEPHCRYLYVKHIKIHKALHSLSLC